MVVGDWIYHPGLPIAPSRGNRREGRIVAIDGQTVAIEAYPGLPPSLYWSLAGSDVAADAGELSNFREGTLWNAQESVNNPEFLTAYAKLAALAGIIVTGTSIPVDQLSQNCLRFIAVIQNGELNHAESTLEENAALLAQIAALTETPRPYQPPFPVFDLVMLEAYAGWTRAVPPVISRGYGKACRNDVSSLPRDVRLFAKTGPDTDETYASGSDVPRGGTVGISSGLAIAYDQFVRCSMDGADTIYEIASEPIDGGNGMDASPAVAIIDMNGIVNIFVSVIFNVGKTQVNYLCCEVWDDLNDVWVLLNQKLFDSTLGMFSGYYSFQASFSALYKKANNSYQFRLFSMDGAFANRQTHKDWEVTP